MKKWSWKAILGGLAVSFFCWLVILIAVLVPLFIFGMSRGSVDEGPFSSTRFLAFGTLLGLFMDALGGYLAAMWAPTRKLAHAILMGVASIGVSFLFNLIEVEQQNYPAWVNLSWILVLPAAMLGGWWRVRTHGPESQVKPKSGSSSEAPPIASPFGD